MQLKSNTVSPASPSARLRQEATPGPTLRPSGHHVAAPREARRAKRGGARRDRTADLLHAMQALSQLSYGPVTLPLSMVFSEDRYPIFRSCSPRAVGDSRGKTLNTVQGRSQVSSSP